MYKYLALPLVFVIGACAAESYDNTEIVIHSIDLVKSAIQINYSAPDEDRYWNPGVNVIPCGSEKYELVFTRDSYENSINDTMFISSVQPDGTLTLSIPLGISSTRNVELLMGDTSLGKWDSNSPYNNLPHAEP